MYISTPLPTHSMKLIVGLGNPGKRYQKTRHNVGFLVLDTLHEQLSEYGISPWELSKKFNGEIAGCTRSGEKILLLKPMTFMNASGQAVQLVAHYYHISPTDIVIVHDDKDLPLGDIKIQRDRGHAGHNGIRSIIEHIGTKGIRRVRCGIAPKKPIEDTAAFVLRKFDLREKKVSNQMVEQAATFILKEI